MAAQHRRWKRGVLQPNATTTSPIIAVSEAANDRAGDEESTPTTDALAHLVSQARTMPDSPASRHKVEVAIAKLATQLRRRPTLPLGFSTEDLDIGSSWPEACVCVWNLCNQAQFDGKETNLIKVFRTAWRMPPQDPNAHTQAFCAFDQCGWSRCNGDSAALLAHLQRDHNDAFEEAVAMLRTDHNHQDIILGMYQEAVAMVCREAAPQAGCSIDRTALRQLASSVAQDGVESLVCAVCACVHPRVGTLGKRGTPIRWTSPLNLGDAGEAHIFGLPADTAAQLLGVQPFLAKFGNLEHHPNFTESDELADWSLQVPIDDEYVALLCCPEDHRCSADGTHPRTHVVCEHCEVPICAECEEQFAVSKLPVCALANDMWTGFAPAILHDEHVTVMELICASTCVTTMVCFSMEARFGHLLDEAAHMARHRSGARGNVITFPLPWEDLLVALQQHESQDLEQTITRLPRVGAELQDVVRILLKTNRDGAASADNVKSLIHQACVRRDVVVRLILEMKRLGHPSYAGMDEKQVRERAAKLPKESVPPELITILQLDDAHDKLAPQKAATPVDGHRPLETIGKAFAEQRPRAVVVEGDSTESQDSNAVHLAALQRLGSQLTPERHTTQWQHGGGKQHPPPSTAFEVRTGNAMVDQFQPWYFGVAFAFCFKYCTACPDIAGTKNQPVKRWRRTEDDPWVDILSWSRCIARRVESQFRRDWVLGFSIWNYMFRTAINMQQNVYAFTVAEPGGALRSLNPSDLAVAHGELLKALTGTYIDVTGKRQPVNGDLSKLRWVPRLSSAALKILDNVQAKSRKLAGTHEVRKTMRIQTHSYRIRYGTPLFITFSPSERDSTMMIRLARARTIDPALAKDPGSRFYTRHAPELDTEFASFSQEDFMAALPDYDARRTLLARDPMACADGFRVLCLLTLKHLFGLRVCWRCPDCAQSTQPCANIFGSNANAWGGILGRVDACYGSIENQRSGTLHLHAQLFVQCAHQHTPLRSIFQRADLPQLAAEYADYVAHVSRKVYATPTSWQPSDQERVENAWPEYAESRLMVSRSLFRKSFWNSHARLRILVDS